MYGVPKDLLGLLEGRQTYVIGKDGTVKLVYNSQFKARRPRLHGPTPVVDTVSPQVPMCCAAEACYGALLC